jgi:DNA-binding NtrC family response regulator
MVRQMLERMVTRLGYEPVIADLSVQEQLASADVLLIEPVAPLGVTLAQAAHFADPRVPIVCASVMGPPAAFAELGIELADALQKPYSSEQLDAAIMRALASRWGSCEEGSRHDRRAA